jgi:hypothetical protein
MKMKKKNKQSCIEKRMCEGGCKRYLPESELDIYNGKWLCNECEQIEFNK